APTSLTNEKSALLPCTLKRKRSSFAFKNMTHSFDAKRLPFRLQHYRNLPQKVSTLYAIHVLHN
ncbi:MAG: hypothetical protein OIF55_15535, partial [Amphritea sp.]|nr:hypothetical protein [Amphritea sp.]